MKSMPSKILVLAAATSLCALNSCSTQSTEKKESRKNVTWPDGSRGALVVNSTTATATVQSINAAERTLVLRREDGTVTTYTCGPDVRNFNRIEVGDQIKVTLAEELAVVLAKGGLPPVTGESTAIVRSPEGAKPGGRIVGTTAVVARVTAVDPSARMVTLHLPDGTDHKVKVGPDVNLTNVNPGDDVGVRLTQALIIAVGKP